MRVIDPGHQYALALLDGKLYGNSEELLTFVKREGTGYPGNVGSHAGTNIQECLRALIDRLKYLHSQIPHRANIYVIEDLRHALKKLEMRAAQRHGRAWPVFTNTIELMPTCSLCAHIGCEERCRNNKPVENANSSRSGFVSHSEKLEEKENGEDGA